MITRRVELIPIVPFPIVSLGEDLVRLIVTTASEAIGREGIPVVVIRGLSLPGDEARAEELIRDPTIDRFGHPDREYS